MDTNTEQKVDRFRRRLRLLRKANGYTQHSFAEKVGMTRGVYAKVESNVRAIHFDEALLFADVLGVTVDEMTQERPLTVEIPD